MNKTTIIPVYKRKLDSKHWSRLEKCVKESPYGTVHTTVPYKVFR